MTNITTKPDTAQPEADPSYLFDDWFDPIEAGLRERVRGFIEAMIEAELDAVLARPRYGRQVKATNDENAGAAGHRHGHRMRMLTGTFGSTEVTVPRARLRDGDGRTSEWKSQTLRTYQRRTKAADALIASTYLAGTNTRRVRRALAALFGGAGAVVEVVEIRGWRSPVQRRLRDHAARSMDVSERGSASVSQPSTLRMTI